MRFFIPYFSYPIFHTLFFIPYFSYPIFHTLFFIPYFSYPIFHTLFQTRRLPSEWCGLRKTFEKGFKLPLLINRTFQAMNNNKNVASFKNHTQFQNRVGKHALFSFRPKWSKSMPYFRPKWLENHILWRRTYPPPPAPSGGNPVVD